MNTATLDRAEATPEAGKTHSDVEYQMRCELAACCRLTDMYGMSDLASTHISVRIPGPGHAFLVNPLGVLFDEMTASCLLKVDTDGNVLEGDPDLLNPAAFIIHSAIHMAQTHLNCVMHTHTRAINAIAMQEGGLRPLSQKAVVMFDFLTYHDYEGTAVHEDERSRLARDLGPQGRAMILRNHGALTAGESVGEAFSWMHKLETACKFQVDGMSGSAKLHELSAEVIDATRKQGRRMLGAGGFMACGKYEWPGLLRKLERTQGTAWRQ
jgi:ribulose-5-phosphate 4-epimerase/fuculose-1-phosphate aldolase